MPRVELPALLVDDVVAVVAEARPLLVNRDPGPDEPDVQNDAAIGFEIIDPGPDGIDRQATRVWVNGEIALDGAASPGVSEFFAGPRAAVVESADSLRVVLDPITPFASAAVVTVRVESATVGGAHLLDVTYAFEIEDRTAPRLVAAQAVGPRRLRLAFDEDVLVTDPAGFAFERLDVPAVALVPQTASCEGDLVLVEFVGEMTPDARYRVTVTGVGDPWGNPVLPPFDTAVFTGFRPARPAERRFDLWSMLPGYNRRADKTGDLRAFVACLQEVTDLLLADLDRVPDLFDLERAPEPFLWRLLQDLGNPFAFDLDDIGKRRLAAVLVEVFRQKGTAAGIRNAVRFFLGVEVEVIPYTSTTLILGVSLLGVDWELGPSDRLARYAFDVETDRVLTDAERRHLRAIVEYMKPAHTHFVQLVEPIAPVEPDHWELGLSDLAETTYLH